MIPALSARERKLVAVAVLLALIAIIYLGILQPLASGFGERSEERARLAEIYAGNDRLIGRIPSLVRAAQNQRANAGVYSLQALNADQAAEALKERMSLVVEKAGGELGGIEAIETRPGWVAAAIQARMTNAQLVQVLEHLRITQPYVALEALNISADRAVVSGQLDVMDVRIEASVPYTPANAR
jgi:type II secretory pathway component PulM